MNPSACVEILGRESESAIRATGLMEKWMTNPTMLVFASGNSISFDSGISVHFNPDGTVRYMLQEFCSACGAPFHYTGDTDSLKCQDCKTPMNTIESHTVQIQIWTREKKLIRKPLTEEEFKPQLPKQLKQTEKQVEQAGQQADPTAFAPLASAAAVSLPAKAPEKPMPDLNEIKKVMTILKKPGQVVELRALKTKEGTWSGYYDNFDDLANDAFELSIRETTPNVYFTLQNINKELLARRTNKVKGFTANGDTTSDKDVDSFDFLYVDFDPRRPQGISSTDSEKKAAYVLAQRVRSYLTKKGFASLFCDSGNGYHLLIRIDVPCDKEGCKLVKDLLNVLCKRFGTTAVDSDVRVCNPSRICKLYGTVARKGEHTAERPWRLSKVLDAPELHTSTKEQLTQLLDELKSDQKSQALAIQTQKKRVAVGVTEMEAEIERLGLGVGDKKESTDKDGNIWSKWHLVCLFNEEHKGSDAYLYLCTDGARAGEWGYHCSHNSCSQNKKEEFQKISGGFSFDAVPASVESTYTRKLSLIKASSLKPKHVRWFWENRVLANKPNILFGEPGLGKGFVGDDFIARMTSGADFYDGPNENDICDAIICCSEDSWEETLLPRLIVAGADTDRVHFLLEEHGTADSVEEGLMALDRDLPRMAEMLKEYANIRIILIDPLATYMGELDPNKDKEVRPVYTAMKTFAEKHNVCFILVAHPNKNEEASAINRLSGAKALTSVFRNTWLVEKDPEDKNARMMVSVKGNLAGEAAKGGLRFRIENVADTGIVAEDGETIKDIGKLVWQGETDKDADELLQAAAGGGKDFKKRKEESDALQLLREYLANGAQTARDFYDKATLLGLSDRSVRVAKARLKLKHRKICDAHYWATTIEQLDAKKDELDRAGVVLVGGKPAGQ